MVGGENKRKKRTFENQFETAEDHCVKKLGKVENILSICDYREEDYDEVAKLWILTDLGNSERGDTNEVIKQTLRHGGKFLVIELKSNNQIKTIIGTLWMTNDGRRILLHHFGILPEYQGKGYSKLLLKEALQYVKKIRITGKTGGTFFKYQGDKPV